MLGRRGGFGEHRSAAASREDDERALIERIVRRDLRAFEALFRLYHPRLTRFLGAMVRRPTLVEEVLNDTLMAVWNKPEKYNGACKVSTWVFAIAYRKALHALRGCDEPVESPHNDVRECPDAGPEQLIGQRQARQALLAAMGQLSADHRAVVDLTYFHEIGYREIAEIMGCPVDTVKTRMFHARRRLKAALAGRLGDWL
jgi:RNA polymerase sigma-70 factor (ECF subfamily)